MKSNRLKQSLEQQRGMTLVEVVVVIAVAGILAAATAPNIFGAIQRERRRQVANDIANVYREARNQAMSRGQAYMVTSNGDQLITTENRGGRTSRTVVSRDWIDGLIQQPRSRRTLQRDVSRERTDDDSRALHDQRPLLRSERFDVCRVRRLGDYPTKRRMRGRGMVIYIADRDASGVVDAMKCDSPASSYESVGGHVIRIGRNGEIGPEGTSKWMNADTVCSK